MQLIKPRTMRRFRRLRRRLAKFPTVFIAVGVISVTVLIREINFKQKHYTFDIPKDVLFESTNMPSETPPEPATYKSTAGPTEPKMIRIPSLGISGFVQKVGIDQNQQVAVPNNIHMAGWFINSQKPGQPGLSIIDGHVDGMKLDGIFKHLAELKVNDTFSIELGNGSELSYTVIDTTTVPTAEAANWLFSQDPKTRSQLNLITCGGSFDEQARVYEKRVIVSARLNS